MVFEKYDAIKYIHACQKVYKIALKNLVMYID